MNKKAFTLIELIVVIAILGIIALIATSSALGIFNKSKNSLYDTQVEIIESAAKKWVVANSGYLPVDGSSYELKLSKLVSDGYLDDGDVIDPSTKEPINGYIEIYFDSASNQFKSKLINKEEETMTQDSIFAKINVQDTNSTSSGLYSDVNSMDERYYFKGDNPNNYIVFNNEQWRIVSLEADGKIKIIKETGIAGQSFSLTDDNITWPSSSLKAYLNETYFNSFDRTKKELLSSGQWCYRYLSVSEESGSSFNDSQVSEQFCDTETINSYIGIMSVKEIMEASFNDCEFGVSATNNCTSYLNNGEDYWILNYNNNPMIMTNSGYISYSSASSTNIKTRPVLYLISTIKLTGSGTESDPFKIK